MNSYAEGIKGKYLRKMRTVMIISKGEERKEGKQAMFVKRKGKKEKKMVIRIKAEMKLFTGTKIMRRIKRET